MKTIEEAALAILTIAAVGLGAGLPAQMNAQTAQIGNLQISVANIQPIDSNSIPDQGTFYLLQDCLNYGMVAVPLPDDCCLEYPAYSLGIDGLFLVDNTGTTGETIQQLVAPLLIIPDPNAGVTNPIPWPLSLSQLTLVSPEDVPEFGTFYLYTDQLTNDSPCPLPDDTCTNCPVYSLASIGFDGIFLIDDTGFVWPEAPDLNVSPLVKYPPNALRLVMVSASNSVAILILTNTLPGTNYEILAKQRLSDPTWTAVDVVTGPVGQNWMPVVIPLGASLNSAFFWACEQQQEGGLWLEIPSGGATVQGQLTVVLHNTTQEQQYDILTKQALSDPTWTPEQSVFGGAADSTTVTLPLTGQTNLFVWARFGGSSDGSGLPDWWQLLYFGHLGVDPYALDPAGDGWNNLQKFQMGIAPNVFSTPPAPQGLQATLVSPSAATLTWQPSSGMVIGYTIFRFDYVLFQGTNITIGMTNMFVDAGFISYPLWDHPVTYAVQADYAQGNSALSSEVSPYSVAGGDLPLSFVQLGPGGSTELVITDIPSGAYQFEITRVDWSYYANSDDQSVAAGTATFEIPVSSFTNGAYTLPSNMVGLGSDGSTWYIRTVWPDGSKSSSARVGYLEAASNYSSGYTPGRLNDGSVQLVQDMTFLLRAAGLTSPFLYSYDAGYGNSQVIQPADYAFVSFYNYNENTGDGLGYVYDNSYLDWGLPFQENYRYRNFVFSTTNIDVSSGFLNTGCQPDYSLQAPYTFFFSSTNTAAGPGILSPSETTWMVPYTDPTALGIENSSGPFYLPNNISNYFGLKLLSVKVAHADSGTLYLDTLSAEQTLPSSNATYYFYPQFDQPQFQTVGFYFGKTSDNFAPQYVYGGGYRLKSDVLPGDPSFSPTNPQPLLIAGMGQPLEVAVFSKQIIVNGDTSKPVYISQYFDTAYKVDATGAVTSQETGILSPYGTFLPTEPGNVALVTMPDENGQRGTGIVQVVSIQLDANHDGVMDLSFFGSDTTWGNSYYTAREAHPFTFWANNNYDRGHSVDCNPFGQDCDYEQDDLGTNEIAALPALQQVPDGLFTSNFIPVIPCTRDLEDYARLWIPGLSSLLASLPTNYTVQLVTDGVQLRMFQAVESDGGTNYLFNETTASNQVADSASLYLGVLANGFPIILNGKTNVGEHFIFCGISPGTATVSLQVLDQGQNLTAIAPGSIQILDVKDMYERWTVGERPSYGPSNVAQHAVENMPDGESIPFQYPTNVVVGTPYILFVHGWNMETWQKDRYAETAFKRLYWQGYQGRFGTFRWPTDYDFGPIGGDSDNTPVNDPENYDRSEANAWASGAGLLNLLTGLNRQYSGKVYLMAHSMGNVVAGEALRLAGSTQLVNTYVALQGAVPAHAYDPSATTRTIPFPLDSGTPNRYAHYWTDTSPSYFNGSIGAGSYVNFYNPKDYALNMWAIDQNVKPLPPYSWSLGTGGTESYYRATSLFSAQQLFFQGDTYPIFSHIIQARCYALGAQSNMVGFAQQNLINLWPPDTHPGGNYGAHVWHSAEFRSDNMLQQKVWHALLGQQGFELKY